MRLLSDLFPVKWFSYTPVIPVRGGLLFKTAKFEKMTDMWLFSYKILMTSFHQLAKDIQYFILKSGSVDLFLYEYLFLYVYFVLYVFNVH